LHNVSDADNTEEAGKGDGRSEGWAVWPEDTLFGGRVASVGRHFDNRWRRNVNGIRRPPKRVKNC
jgi:hypothetical protein